MTEKQGNTKIIQDKIEEIFDVLEAQAESRKENFEEVEETEAKEWEYGYEAGISDVKKELKEELLKEVEPLYSESKIKQLIQDKKEDVEDKLEEITGFDRLNKNDLKARKQTLEELLEEVQEQ